MGMETDGLITYSVTWQLPDGGQREQAPVRTRERAVGELVNFPMGPDGKARSGKGYVWRVVEVDQDACSLVLAFERPHPEMSEPG
jgi:hypothetical protein